jgi:hypothetical protein
LSSFDINIKEDLLIKFKILCEFKSSILKKKNYGISIEFFFKQIFKKFKKKKYSKINFI